MTTPTGKNRQDIASTHVGSQSQPAPSVPKPSDPAESSQSGIGALLRGMGLGVETEPLKEMRVQMTLDMQFVYLTIREPVAGVKLRWPVVAAITPRVYSPTRAQHLS